MPITFVGSDQDQQAANATDISLVPPVGHAIDDVGIVFLWADDDTGTWSQSSGSDWTKILEVSNTGGRDRTAALFVKRFTSASEATPTFDYSVSQEHSGTMHVFRGVDNVEYFDADPVVLQGLNDTTPNQPDITTFLDNSALVAFHGATHDDITVAGAPAGFTLGEAIVGSTLDWRQQIVAYLLDAGTAGTQVIGSWTHTSSPTGTAEYTCITLALRELQPLHVTDFNTTEQFNWTDTNLVASGDGFGAVQGSGTIEIWDDTSGTTQVTQTVVSWSDTSITINPVQGSLGNDTRVYVVVTNDLGEVSGPLEVIVGLEGYDLVIEGLLPDHWWQLDNSYDDDAGSNPMTTDIAGGGGAFTSTTICEKNTNSWQLSSVTARRGCADSTNINIATLQNRSMGGWIQFGGIQQSLGSVYKEGGGVNNVAILAGLGNVLMAQYADTGDDNVQAYSDFKLTANRPYHIMWRFSHTEGTPEFRFYIDGEEQAVTDGNPLTSGNLDSHSGDINWGDPDTNLEMGGTDVAFAGMEDCIYAQWASWSVALNKTTEIRDLLFRRGAPPALTISADTQANMQTALDAVADTVRPDWPLAIRVEAPSSGGPDLELVADNITFDSRVTLHLEWRGTGTLTWVNENGSDLDSAKTFASAGGSITVVESVQVRITALSLSTGAAIVGARVLLEADSGGPLAVGTDIISDVTDGSGQASANLRYSADQPVTGRIRKGTSSPLYKTASIVSTVLSTGLDLSVFMQDDE